MKKLAKQILLQFGFEIRKLKADRYSQVVAELSAEELGFIEFVEAQEMTMTSRFRLIATAMAVKHVVEAGIEGDFVECGVYRGGNAILAKKMLDHYADRRAVWLFDTFEGMTEPTDFDKKIINGTPAKEKWQESVVAGGGSSWCRASLADVKENIVKAGLGLEGFRFVIGDVLQTLSAPPPDLQRISVLRLDTDWYESTKLELQVLYPQLVRGGILLIDDYGHWEGAKKAVDEYFCENRPFMSAIDYTGRSMVKP